MKIKKLAVLAAIATLTLPAVPAFAVTTQTGTVTVKWNTQAIATITLNTDYTAAGAQGATVPTFLTNQNGGATGACGGTAAAESPGVVNFFNVTPDSTKFTDCLYENAVNAQVVTNSTNWAVSEAATAGLPAANYSLCALPNGGGGTFPFTVAAALPATQTARAAAPAIVSNATCPAGDVDVNAAGGNLITGESTAFSSAAPANIGEDLELVIAPNAPTGAQSVTVTYTLTAN